MDRYGLPVSYEDPSVYDKISIDSGTIVKCNLMHLDLGLLHNCDLVVAYFQPHHDFPIGTTCEIYHAYSNGIPVICLIHEDIAYDGPMLATHPWLQGICRVMMTTDETFSVCSEKLAETLSVMFAFSTR